jgi:phosphopantothenoylcysteine decarboxylase
MANVLLGVTGSVAAIKAPELANTLRADGHTVKLVLTKAAEYFCTAAALDGFEVVRDADEWPGAHYTRGDAVTHIELRRWAELFVIAPIDANTLAKLAVGIADNCLTCVWRAWDFARPVVLAPAMNTLMWEHPFTRRHLRTIAADFGAGHLPGHLDAELLIAQTNARAKRFWIVPPISKELACGDVGVGAMATIPQISQAISALLAASPPES